MSALWSSINSSYTTHPALIHRKDSTATNASPRHESQYICKHLGEVLSRCLADVMEYRPVDPIEYMAQWIYRYIDNKKREEQVSEIGAVATVT